MNTIENIVKILEKSNVKVTFGFPGKLSYHIISR